MAYTLLITSIWYKQRTIIKYFWFGTIPLLVLGFELLQYPGWVSGTFCLEDLAFGMLGMLAGVIINKILINEKVGA